MLCHFSQPNFFLLIYLSLFTNDPQITDEERMAVEASAATVIRSVISISKKVKLITAADNSFFLLFYPSTFKTVIWLFFNKSVFFLRMVFMVYKL